MKFDRHSLALAVGFSAFVAITGIVPTITAERPRTIQYGVATIPIDAADVLRIDGMLRTPGVSTVAHHSVHDALSLARVVATAHGEDEALDRAHDALMRGDFRRADAIVVTLIEQVEIDAQKVPVGDRDELARLSRIRNQSLLLKANVRMQQGEPAQAVTVLTEISPDTPVNDHVLYLLGENFEALRDFEKAAEFFGQVSKIESTPLRHRALARRAHALFEAEDYKAAAGALDQVISTYSLYPRRWLALWQRGVALEKLGKKEAAAQAYHDTWFEFPYKKVGAQARERVAKYAKQGIIPAKLPSARDSHANYRQLRIDKHWDIARELFTELKQDNATESGTSEFEHDIDFQLALNAYAQREFDEARRRLEALQAAYEGGDRRGISRYLLYKYLSATYRRLGDTTAALAALEKMSEGYGSASAKRAKAEFYEDLGLSSKALEIYDDLYTKYKKRGWHYSWLLYKSGKFGDAYDNFTRLAERSSGSRRAKYLYWAARTLERAGKESEAREVFTEIAQRYDFDYYALQAANRVLDIDQRTSVAGQLAASAETLSNSADEVLDALEEASARASADAFVASDPRAAPRHALWGSGEVPTDWSTGKKCDPKDKSTAKYCKAANVAMAPVVAIDEPIEDEASVIDDDPEPKGELDARAKGDAEVPSKKMRFDPKAVPRIEYSTAARIYWDGRLGSGLAFARARQGEVVGPMPKELRAYDETSYDGGLERAAREYGDLFPELVRSYWLYISGFEKGARWAARDVAIEFRELKKRTKPRSKPHQLDDKRWDYLIDNRRRDRSAFWGIESDELRFPVPKERAGQKKLLERQQRIHAERHAIEDVVTDALKEVGDHYMVRRLTLARGGWYRKDLRTEGRKQWMQAYPRGFPRLLVAHAERNGINPYLLWALMTVESSYNPDSLSTADALGLLQVIPRTGLKTAIMLGDEQFGPFDLLEADTAIEHGAFYFSRLVRKFRGQELFAIAGYNGGPHRVGDWIEDRGHTMPMDEFVEEIPFNQARLYVKKVLRFLSIYLTLYEGRETLYVGQNVRTDYRPDPNF